MARAVVNGNVIDYPADSGFEFEASAVTRSDEGSHTLSRDTQAVSGGLTTSSAEVAANYEQTAPTDGMGASGGGIIASVKAKGGDSLSMIAMGVIIMLGGLFLIFKPVPGMAAIVGGGPMFGLSVVGLGAAIALAGWMKDEYPWAVWVLAAAAAFGVYVVFRSKKIIKGTEADLTAKKVALSNIVGGVGALEETDPDTFAKVTGAIKGVAGSDNDLVKREVEKAKATN